MLNPLGLKELKYFSVDQLLHNTYSISLFDQLLYNSYRISLFDQLLHNTYTISLLDQHLHNTYYISLHASSLKSPLHGLWEPNDLKFEPDIPEFKELHIRMKGYDYPILESYAKYVHRVVKVMFNLDSDAWPSPAKSVQIRTFLPGSTSVNQKYELSEYVRTVAAENVPTTTVPILLQFIQKNCPQGIQVALKEPDPEDDEFRYVPDYEILELQAQKEAIASGKIIKK
ncbi:unnamed protein product [Candidula unifasciata]|uniref:Small ribosomal subunit protein uS10 domain-containing protein n=1 Tax=Candidula unifasciata TaxID=100452 RepID=A0A8S3Z7Z9_9EUPU|nr:unnamed protein product [Candidula unifasciata]